MAEIDSVAGRLEPSDLGVTLMHEHLLLRDHRVVVNYPHLVDNTAEQSRVTSILRDLRSRGVRTIVDLTTIDLGRDIDFIVACAEASGMQVIAATGMHLNPPAYFITRPIDVLIDCFSHDITKGIGHSNVRAGVIKLATDRPGVTDVNEKILRAGARVHRQTGVPIYTHTYARGEVGERQQEIFQDEGVDLGRVVIGHSGDTTDTAYLKRLMERGSFIGMDRFGLDDLGGEHLAGTDERVAVIAELCAAGYAERMMLSHDAVLCWETLPADAPLIRRNPEWSIFHISDQVIPKLRAAGVSDDTIHTLMVDNPARCFSASGAY